MSGYDRWLEPPSTRREDFERTEHFEAGSHDPLLEETTTCYFEGDIEGTLSVEDGNGWWSGECPECGTELEREIDLCAEMEDARESAAIDYQRERDL